MALEITLLERDIPQMEKRTILEFKPGNDGEHGYMMKLEGLLEYRIGKQLPLVNQLEDERDNHFEGTRTSYTVQQIWYEVESRNDMVMNVATEEGEGKPALVRHYELKHVRSCFPSKVHRNIRIIAM